MPHKADKSFFDKKRPWSKRKDAILSYYLTPYLAKVSRLKRPILLIDGFAGPGRFRDGKAGSPEIICGQAEKARRRGAEVAVWCIESERELFDNLSCKIAKFAFASARHGEFNEFTSEIGSLASSNTVFLYLDPYTVEGLDFTSLDSVFRQIRESRSSVELLLNFNAASFVRRALALINRCVPPVDPEIEDSEQIDAQILDDPSGAKLDRIVGGDWWRLVLDEVSPFMKQVARVAERYCDMLRRRFDWVGMLPVRAQHSHLVPKYYLLFATRHPDGFELMNEAMVSSRERGWVHSTLFEEGHLERLVRGLAVGWIRRRDLILEVMRREFCEHSRKAIRGTIADLLRSGALHSETGKARINDDTRVRTTAASP